MSSEKTAVSALWGQNIGKVIGMIVAACVAGWLASKLGTTDAELARKQITACGVFVLIISATLLFWNLRLAVAFIGISVMLAMKVMTLPEFIIGTELDIILFLVGMMTLVGVLKDLGLFTWLIQTIINAKHMTGMKFVLILMLLSGIMPGIVDEVTSIVFVLALVFQVCDTLKLRPTPFVLMSVMATNIGSTGTMLGNPVGILIGTKAQLSFGDFIEHATPIMLLCLVATLVLMLVWYRKDIALLGERLEQRRETHLGLGPLVKIPYKRSLAILLLSLIFIASHHTMETKLGLAPNTMLIAAPLTIAGILMLFRPKRARHYIESEVEWWTLLFFLMLFSVAASLSHTGVTSAVATKFSSAFGTNKYLLTPLIVSITAVGSAFVDNIVFVATFIPIIKELVNITPSLQPLWWALLFGACLGGNITAIGSTANIVALGMLEKRYSAKVAFFEWLKIGLVVGVLTCAISSAVVLTYFKAEPEKAQAAVEAIESFAASASQQD